MRGVDAVTDETVWLGPFLEKPKPLEVMQLDEAPIDWNDGITRALANAPPRMHSVRFQPYIGWVDIGGLSFGYWVLARKAGVEATDQAKLEAHACMRMMARAELNRPCHCWCHR